MIEHYKNLNIERVFYTNSQGLSCLEKFKDIPDYEGIYQISDLGRVKSVSRVVIKNGKYPFTCKEKILKLTISNAGYLRVSIRKDGVEKRKSVHQLVSITFLGHVPSGFELVVNHLNFIKTDNSLSNLEIITQRENSNLKHIKSSSNFVGVFRSKKYKKWYSQILLNGKKIFLGGFDNEIEASQYYQNALLAIKNGEEIKTKLHKFSSGYKGVVWDKSRNKWKSDVFTNSKKKYLGRFETEQEAINACVRFYDNYSIPSVSEVNLMDVFLPIKE